MNPMKVGQVYYPKTPITTSKNISTVNTVKSLDKSNGLSFAHLLDESLNSNSLLFSQHAQNRLSERGINLSLEQIDRLYQGLEKAKQKGSKESLFLMENLAFVVSVKNQTVITAMDKENMSEQVITNIDSAVLL